jgi:putative tryptophan/tyrosine transport system substrate-binding protein
VIGFLIPPPATAEGTLRALAAFRRGLAEADNVEGKNLAIEYRFANFRPELIPELAADLVRLNMKGIFAAAPEAVTAVRNATGSIPIVALDLESDPALNEHARISRPTAYNGTAEVVRLLASSCPHLTTRRLPAQSHGACASSSQLRM